MTVVFDPDSWTKSAKAVDEAGRNFRSEASAVMDSNSDVNAIGCTNGGTLMDATLATVVPPVMEAMRETIAEISSGMLVEAQGMSDTGYSYEATEEQNANRARIMQQKME